MNENKSLMEIMVDLQREYNHKMFRLATAMEISKEKFQEELKEIQVKYDQGHDYEAVNKYYTDLKKPKSNTEYSQMMKNKWKR